LRDTCLTKLNNHTVGQPITTVLRQAEFRASFDAFCVYLSSVLRIKCSAKTPARTQSRKTLGAVLITVVLQLMIIYTPFFNDIFKTQPLTLYEVTMTIAVSSIVFCAVEIEKKIKRMRK
jgi:magnesium-transporting ATPase (P-type)